MSTNGDIEGGGLRSKPQFYGCVFLLHLYYNVRESQLFDKLAAALLNLVLWLIVPMSVIFVQLLFILSESVFQVPVRLFSHPTYVEMLVVEQQTSYVPYTVGSDPLARRLRHCHPQPVV